MSAHDWHRHAEQVSPSLGDPIAAVPPRPAGVHRLHPRVTPTDRPDGSPGEVVELGGMVAAGPAADLATDLATDLAADLAALTRALLGLDVGAAASPARGDAVAAAALGPAAVTEPAPPVPLVVAPAPAEKPASVMPVPTPSVAPSSTTLLRDLSRLDI